jgi:patatin-like phospholipase/acyl hydrolase
MASPLRLLSLGSQPCALRTEKLDFMLIFPDGGGIRGLSELIILDEIMHRIRVAANLTTEPCPADYFDMICGTSTGGYYLQIKHSY